MRKTHFLLFISAALLGFTSLSFPFTPKSTKLDTVEIEIPCTWVYDVVEKSGVIYFTAESTGNKGILFKFQNDSTIVKVSEFGSPCLSFGFINDTFFLGMGSIGKVLKSTSGGSSWDTTVAPVSVNSVYRIFQPSSGDLWIGTGNNNGDIFQANYLYTTADRKSVV